MPPQVSQMSYHLVEEEEEPLLLQKDVTKPLRVCCYGSSSPKTPDKYMKEAYQLGLLLAKRGHTLVNGAGAHGCMSAMNNGAVAGDGHIVGVMHEMFVVDGADWLGVCGTHDAFRKKSQDGTGPIREILIAGGDDLQERKKLLVDKADALIVLPGGPGTFDELWEMACTRNLGLSHIPIVCVNVDGYYEAFRNMLDRAYEDKLTKLSPSEIIHFEPTAEDAVRWIEDYHRVERDTTPTLRKREKPILCKETSLLHSPTTELDDSQIKSASKNFVSAATKALLVFSVGMIAGAGLASRLLSIDHDEETS